MVDVFISYPQRERALMLPIKQRLEALGLILFVDVDGRLDGEATFPEALDKGVRASKAVLGCWSAWALTRRWVQTECAIGMNEYKLVAVERAVLSESDVPALFYLVDRKPLSDFDGTAPHEGWAMTLSALATKLKLWAEKRPDHPEVDAVRDKILVLEKAALAERAALDAQQPSRASSTTPRAATASDAVERAWAGIERSLDASHYRRFERVFENDPAAFLLVIEAEARAKALERWASTDRQDPDAIAETLRTGLFPALQEVAERALAAAKEAARQREADHVVVTDEMVDEILEQMRSDNAAAEAEGIAKKKAAGVQRAAKYGAEGRIKVDAAIFAPRDSEAAQAGWLKPGAGKSEWFKDLDIGPEMVVVPSGYFMMGSNDFDSEKPPHRIAIIAPFAVSVTPITRSQFAAFDSATNHGTSGRAYGWKVSEWKHDTKFSWRNPGFAQQDDHPVVCVNWHDAAAYAAWLEKQTGKSYRLLSEAEWEYCCRATTETAYSTGTDISPQQANFGRNEKGTTPVRKYPSNLWGLHDMHGNVWEWCEDAWHEHYQGAPNDGSDWTGGSESSRVVRGGSWFNSPTLLRSSFRYGLQPAFRDFYFGFRVARVLSPARTP